MRTAHRLGIASKLEPNASIAFGTSEVSLTELVGAYVPFANGGQGITPHVVLKIRTDAGKVLYARPPDQLGQVIDPRNVAMMNTMMQETLLSGTAHKAELPGWMAAGKTGTSQDFRDAWFIGYTSKLVTGVWLGNDDNSPTRKATGGGLPVEIWTRFMQAAHQGVPVATLPNSQAPGFFSNFAQAAPQSSGGLQPNPQVTASQITAPYPPPASASLAPLPQAGADPARADATLELGATGSGGGIGWLAGAAVVWWKLSDDVVGRRSFPRIVLAREPVKLFPTSS